MGGGTEAFPDLGEHCEHRDCNQLDFLPFKCDRCKMVFCLEHRSYKAHDCPKGETGNRVVFLCDECGTSIESDGGDANALLQRHRRSGGCDPEKKKKERCPVRRCREVLTFSNNSVCKTCQMKVCLKHRFPADHDCKGAGMPGAIEGKRVSVGEKLLAALTARVARGCRQKNPISDSPPATPKPVRAR